MTVQDLLNVLHKFPGATEVKLSGSVTVGDTEVAKAGKLTVAPARGKGALTDVR